MASNVASVGNGGEFNSFGGTLQNLKVFGDGSFLYLYNQGVLMQLHSKDLLHLGAI